MSDNPFSEPDDDDRTIIRPSPGRRTPAPPRLDTAPAEPSPLDTVPSGPAPRLTPLTGEGVEGVAMAVNPLVAAAAPLLQLLARLRNTANQPDPGDLRERAVRAMRGFEQRVRDEGLPAELLPPAHYALCASLDDVVLNTPWGSTGVWDARSLVSTFHHETRAGDRFFDLLTQMRQNPGKFLPVIELMYLCLSLGFQGRYRLSPRGPAELDRLREETYAVIVRQRQPPEPDLSPHWVGVAAPYRPVGASVPLWVGASAGLAILAALFIWFSTSLGAASDAVFAAMLNAPPNHMPQIARAAPIEPPPAPVLPEPKVTDRLCAVLQPEVDKGLVSVRCGPSAATIRVRNRGMFASGSAIIEPQFTGLLDRIGRALKDEQGAVRIIGYTDSQPIHTVQFASNFELSAARADAAKAVIAGVIGDPARLIAEGRGEDDPIASNATPEGREENRRIEIVLTRPG